MFFTLFVVYNPFYLYDIRRTHAFYQLNKNKRLFLNIFGKKDRKISSYSGLWAPINIHVDKNAGQIRRHPCKKSHHSRLLILKPILRISEHTHRERLSVMVSVSEVRGEESVGTNIFGEVRREHRKLACLVGVLLFFGFYAALDYDEAFNHHGATLLSQVIYDGFGIVLALSLFFASSSRYWNTIWPWLARGFFVVGILLFIIPLSPWCCDINGQRWWFQLWNFRINICLWGELFLLPGVVRLIAKPFTIKRILLLVGLLLFVNASIHETRLSSAWIWFNSVIALMLLATLSLQFRRTTEISSRDRRVRIRLVVFIGFIIISPILYAFFFNGFHFYVLITRFAAWFAATWHPERMKGYTFTYQIWMIYHNFVEGGLTGSSHALTARQCVGLKSAISEFVLQIVGFRFGFISVLIVIADSVALAYFCFRQALRASVLEFRLWQLGLSLLLVLYMFASITRTLGLLPIMPATSYPFLAYGANITLWSFVCLGLLFQDKRLPEKPVVPVNPSAKHCPKCGWRTFLYPPDSFIEYLRFPINRRSWRKEQQCEYCGTRLSEDPDPIDLLMSELSEKAVDIIYFGPSCSPSDAVSQQGQWLCDAPTDNSTQAAPEAFDLWKQRDERLCKALADFINARLLEHPDIGVTISWKDVAPYRCLPPEISVSHYYLASAFELESVRSPQKSMQDNLTATLQQAIKYLPKPLGHIEFKVREHLEKRAKSQPESLSLRGIWLISGQHTDHGAQIERLGKDYYRFKAWYDEREDYLWKWETVLTPEEVEQFLADSANAVARTYDLLDTSREWHVTSPSRYIRPYTKHGKLGHKDGYPISNREWLYRV